MPTLMIDPTSPDTRQTGPAVAARIKIRPGDEVFVWWPKIGDYGEAAEVVEVRREGIVACLLHRNHAIVEVPWRDTMLNTRSYLVEVEV